MRDFKIYARRLFVSLSIATPVPAVAQSDIQSLSPSEFAFQMPPGVSANGDRCAFIQPPRDNNPLKTVIIFEKPAVMLGFQFEPKDMILDFGLHKEILLRDGKRTAPPDTPTAAVEQFGRITAQIQSRVGPKLVQICDSLTKHLSPMPGRSTEASLTSPPRQVRLYL